MTPRELLDLDVSLLLLRHGKEALLSSLARRIQLSDEVLQQELSALLNAKIDHPSKKRHASKPFVLDSLLEGHENKAVYLRQLCARFENRTFLPELRDVKRFLDRHGQLAPNIKSRMLAQSTLFRVLVNLEVSELMKLLAEPPVGAETSSLGLISDEILGRNRTR